MPLWSFLILAVFLPISSTSSAAFEHNFGGENYVPEVEWTCGSDSIEVLVHTWQPFHGFIHPSVIRRSFPNCTTQGSGERLTRLKIPLNTSDESLWEDCGIHFEPMSSTLWVLLEVNVHPMVKLGHDRTVNVSCAGWTEPEMRNKGNEKGDFQLAVVSSSVPISGPLDTLFFGSSYNLSVLALANNNQSLANILVHSCTVTDGHSKLELIDSDGCSMDQRLIGDFVPSTTPTTVPPLVVFSSTNPDDPTVTRRFNHRRITVATARIPTMFRFQNEQQRSAAGNVIQFECTVERCGNDGDDSVSTTAAEGCTRTDCDTKRIIAQQQLQQGQAGDEHISGGVPQQDMEMVSQLLGGGVENEKPGEEEDEDPGSGQTPEPDEEQRAGPESTARTSTTTTKMASATEPWMMLHQQNDTIQVADQRNHAKKAGRKVEGQVEDQLAKRREKQLQKVRTAVRVLELRNAEGQKSQTEEAPTTMKTTTGPAKVTMSPISTTKIVENSIDGNVTQHPTFLSRISTFSSTPAPNSSSYTTSSISPQQRISPDQLLLLFQLCIGLCALFLLGCCCNLLMCCLNRRRASGSALQSPFRSKRGRRHQQVVVGGNSSHTTLTSSLYGNVNNEINNNNNSNNHKNGPKSSQQVGFWISEDGVRSGGRTSGGDTESEQYAPMMSSLYGGLPSTNLNESAQQQQNRRTSVHSYASVKQHGNPQLLCKVPMTELQNGVVAQHFRPQPQQMSSTSPPSHSPSTTTSSTSGGGFSSSGGGGFSSSGGGSGSGTVAYHPYQHRPSTFLPASQHQQEQQSQHDAQRQPSISIPSSVRSSTTLEGTGNSHPSSLADDDHDNVDMVGGNTTPRPIATELGTLQNQQQYNHNKDRTSTFGRPTTQQFRTSNNGNHQSMHNESFSIL